MCGIVGFLDKRGGTERPVGRTLLAMLEALGCRGPDSTGVALFGPPSPRWIAQVKLPDDPERSAAILRSIASAAGAAPVLRHEAMGAYLRLELARQALPHAGRCRRCSSWTAIPARKSSAWVSGWRSSSRSARRRSSSRPTASRRVTGSHGIGHTRLSTESRVDLSHSQPFWAHGVPDLATVHNGHITNYHKLRRRV